MKKLSFLRSCTLGASLIIISAILNISCNRTPEYPGYRLIEKRFVKEVNAECLYLEHIKSGAKVFKIAADDPNKTFSITFKTVPETDAGAPHIMEHSVLNGSKNFPVKSPFDVLMKGSLKTFLNAMTSSDWTMYPVASMNEKDYFNLMHVYLDAVFNPLIYDDPRIFMQEGWHYELISEDAPINYKGVVYNEMKGAYSDPMSELGYQIMKNLFPANGYSKESGGYPSAIPSLTYEQFLDFHRKYYHPSNSFILLYGNADLAKELDFIDNEYLSKYDKSDFKADFPLNPPFESEKEVDGFYPVIEGTPVADQTYLSMSYVIGTNTDMNLTLSLQVLADVLVNQESAPLRKALQEAGIGKDVFAGFMNIHQNVLAIIVQNANASDKDAFVSLLNETLKKVVSEGIDKETLRGVLNRTEFNLREGNSAQKGLQYGFQCLPGWLFAGDPYLCLEYEKPLAEVKKSLESRQLEDLIQKEMIDNPYRLLVVLEPKPGLEKENMEKTARELAVYKKSLNEEELDKMVNETKQLIEYQQKEDSPEALATIPMLKLEDIGKDATWYGVEEKKNEGVPVLFHKEFTNNIIYLTSWFDLRVLPQEMLPYASLLRELIGKLATENYSYEELDNALNITTGGFYASLNSFVPGGDYDMMIPKLSISFKTTHENLAPAFEIISEIINKTNFSDKDRLSTLLKRHQVQLETRVNQDGIGVATTRFESYLNNRGLFGETTSGADYYWFITDLEKKFSDNPDEVISMLSKTADLLFSKGNMTIGITCPENDFGLFAKSFKNFAAALPDKHAEFVKWDFIPDKKNEAFVTASKVQYVVKGYDYKKLGFNWTGKLLVLKQILSTDWLQTRIRVIGGAYGGWAEINRNGIIYFASYRDPNLKETLDNYDATADYLGSFSADSTDMTRYIIGTVARLDQPLTPSGRGDAAFNNYFSGITREQLQAERSAVLSTTADDIKGMKDLVSGVMDKDQFCVYGNEEKIKANKDLFTSILVLQK
jgi:Zn-dependent M16 (insulinase) family peptidase